MVGRASVEAIDEGCSTAVEVSGGSRLFAKQCRFEGGAEGGVAVGEGSKAELEDCSIGLTAVGQACSAVDPGSSAVLRGCRIEGCVAGRLTEVPLSAVGGGSLALEACAVDVGGALVAVGARGAGEGAFVG